MMQKQHIRGKCQGKKRKLVKNGEMMCHEKKGSSRTLKLMEVRGGKVGRGRTKESTWFEIITKDAFGEKLTKGGKHGSRVLNKRKAGRERDATQKKSEGVAANGLIFT